jgi:hypothetical protein
MIKKYKATKDNTITNAYQENLVTRGTGSNMGRADILEVFSIYGQLSSSSGFSSEKSRILVQFDVETLTSDRNSGAVPSDASYYLKLYNARHAGTLPENFTLAVTAISSSWEEGLGLDMENYSDLTYDVRGSNWIKREGSTSWETDGGGGDYHSSPSYTASFNIGTEDLEVDVTTLVNEWVAGTKQNYGFGIFLTGSLEDSSRSYYTKKFFARSSHQFFDRPCLEARWDSSRRDDRSNFYSSSSLAPASDNLNTIYLYNYSRGRLANIPSVGTGLIYVDLYETLSGSPETLCLNTPATGGYVSTGIYSCSVCVNTTSSTLYDVWHDGSSNQFHTGTISIKSLSMNEVTDTGKYVFSVSNRQNDYYYDQTHRIRIYARNKNWSPSIYTTATNVPDSLIFPSASYQIYRVVDDRVIIPYDSGSTQSTRLSYDSSGSYFDLDATILEPNYTYGLRLSIYDTDTDSYEQQSFDYKFRVVKNVY